MYVRTTEYDTSKCSNYGCMFDYLRWLRDIRYVQLWGYAKVEWFGTVRVTAEWEGFLLSTLSVAEEYEYLYLMYVLERHMDYHDLLLYEVLQLS